MQWKKHFFPITKISEIINNTGKIKAAVCVHILATLLLTSSIQLWNNYLRDKFKTTHDIIILGPILPETDSSLMFAVFCCRQVLYTWRWFKKRS